MFITLTFWTIINDIFSIIFFNWQFKWALIWGSVKTVDITVKKTKNYLCNERMYFSPFCFASREIIGVKFGNRQTDRQTDRQIL